MVDELHDARQIDSNRTANSALDVSSASSSRSRSKRSSTDFESNEPSLDEIPSAHHLSNSSLTGSQDRGKIKTSRKVSQPEQLVNSDACRKPPLVLASTAEQVSGSDAMTTTVSKSSYMSQTQTATAANAGPSPYGTRSRHKPDSSRPNYAEDVEMDFEVPIPSTNNNTQNITTTSAASRKASIASEGKASHRAVEQDNTISLRGGSRRSLGGRAISPTTSIAAKGSQDSGSSTFSASSKTNGNHSATNSKKRKAPHGHDKASSNGNGPGYGNSHSSASHSKATMTRRSSAMVTASQRETNMMTFEKSRAILKNGKLEADNGMSLSINDHVYLVCEPPGDPYYLCRIMEFIHRDGDNSKSSPIETMRVNWYYRPRDVLRYNNDTRLVYGTMHSDVCPITSLRGKCRVLHRSEIGDMEEYRKLKDCFWFTQIFDRFIHRWYEVIPTSQIINVPEKVKKALDERWKYIVVETSRVKELTSAVKTCKRCSGYCPTTESVECAVCHSTYHMNCVRPPLLKKPSRGFAWACGPCNRAQERRLEARHTALITDAAAIEAEDEEVLDEEEEDPATTANTTAPSPSGVDAESDPHSATQAEVALAKMWPMRYLGIHCRVEDALQYDDRAIYPRASSRLGPRHQATVSPWYGRPVEYVKSVEIKRRYAKHPTHKKDGKLTKETIAALEADRAEKAKRPKWVQDEPPGYVRRGEDLDNSDSNNTARLLFKMPEEIGASDVRHSTRSSVRDEESVDAYMERAKGLAKTIGVKPFSTNFLDMALKLLIDNNYDAEAALRQLKKVDRRKDLHEPELSKEELRRFEDGVAKYGSELRTVRQHVKKLSHADAVRFYYMWKKTPRGQEIWGSYGGRKGTKKKAEVDAAYRLPDDVADDYDDSAFDTDKAIEKKRGFQCKFCSSRKSRQWRRAPGVTPGQTVPADGKNTSSGGSKDKSNQLLLALCQRCAGLWRKYAIKWENVDEVAKKAVQGGGKTWRKRMDEVYLQELQAANDVISKGADDFDAVTGGSGPNGIGNSSSEKAAGSAEPARKKSKVSTSAAVNGTTSATHSKEAGAIPPKTESVPKKKEKPPPPPKPVDPSPPPPPPPLPLTQPKLRQLPCAVCRSANNEGGDKLFTCKQCRLSVHRDCYGIDGQRSSIKWLCDMCLNDRTPQVSLDYKCVLCPVSSRHHDLLEPLKQSKHKKTEREREKDRGERELASQFLKNYAQAQKERGWPEMPREALKKTANNNWVHVICATWTQEIKFSDASALEVAEGIARGPIPAQRFDLVCKFCSTMQGLCVSCPVCHDNFHIGCAHLAGCTFGFDVTPVKGSRRDHVSIVTLGQETGYMTAAVWCKEHQVKTIVHTLTEMAELNGDRVNTLQLFVRTYKQADLTFAGTVRKANLVSQLTKGAATATATSNSPTTSTHPASLNSTSINNRRTSAALPTSSGTKAQRASLTGEDSGYIRNRTCSPSSLLERRCYRCMIDVSPKWWKVDDPVRVDRLKNEIAGMPSRVAQVNGAVMLPFDVGSVHPIPPVNPRNGLDSYGNGGTAQIWQCHKCHWKAKHNPDIADEVVAQGGTGTSQQQINVSGWPAYQRPSLINGVIALEPAESARTKDSINSVGKAGVDPNGFSVPKTRPTPPPQLPMHHNPLGPSFYSQNHRNGFQHQRQLYQHSNQARPASGNGPPSLPPPQSRHSSQMADDRPPSQSALGRPIYTSRQPPPSPILPMSASSSSFTTKHPRQQTTSAMASLTAAAERDGRPGTGSSSNFVSMNADANGPRSPIEGASRGFGGQAPKRHPQSPAQSRPQTSPAYQQPQHMASRLPLPPPPTPPEATFRTRPSLPSTPQESQQQLQHHPQLSISSQEASRSLHDEYRHSQGMNRDNGSGNGSSSGYGHSRKASSTSTAGAATPAAQTVTYKHPSTPREIGHVAGLARAAPTPVNVAPTIPTGQSAAPNMTPGKADGRPGSGVGGASASPSLKNLLH